MKWSKALLYILVLICSVSSFAQQNTYTVYTTENGLPSEIIYDICQSEDGYLWISTEGGLVKFNGKNFIKNPIPLIGEKEIISIFSDSTKRLWFIALSGDIFYLENGMCFQLEDEKYTLDKGFIDISEDFNGRLWLSGRFGSNISILDVADLQKVLTLDKDSHGLESIESICHFKDKNMIISVREVHLLDNSNELKKISLTKKDTRYYTSPMLLNDSTYLLSSNKQVLIALNSENIPGDEIFSEFNSYFNSTIRNIFIDRDRTIFISTKNGIFILKQQDDGTIHFNHILKNFNTGIILTDKEQNYWVATTKGLIRMASFDIQFFENGDDGRFISLAGDKDHLFVGTDKNKFLVYNKKFNLISDNSLSDVKDDIIYEMTSTKDNIYVATNEFIYSVRNDPSYSNEMIASGFFKSVALDKEDKLWVGGGYYCYYFHPDSCVKHNFFNGRTYAIYPIDSTNILLGTVKGLFTHNYSKNTTKKLLGTLEEDIRDIKVDKDSTYWIATQSAGLLIARNNEIIRTLNTDNGLNSNNCRSILLLEDQVWLATNKGIARINKNTFEINIISQSIGLPSNEIHDIMYWNKFVVAATSDGLAVLKPDKEISFLTPELNFSSVKIVEKDTSILEQYMLKPNQRNIKIEFDGVSFHNVDDIMYEYKMEGIDNDWIRTKNNIAQYPSMPHGDYTFFVRTKGINSDWSKTKTMKFGLAKYFFENTWFYFFLALIFGLLIYWYYSETRNKEKSQKELISSQLTALRAQMNPHFIFNSLNSLSYFIENGEKRIANKYVSQFSKLMRLILNNSDKSYIPLKEELEALKLYVSLEALRFDDDLNYSFDVADSIDESNIGIPPLLVQPYVENAILHGLKPKKGKKTLKIIIKKLKEKVTIIVEDNGIGRTQSQKNKDSSKQIYNSKAMGITSKRIDLINLNSNKNHTLVIEDLINDQTRIVGTKVILQLDWIDLKLKQNDKEYNN